VFDENLTGDLNNDIPVVIGVVEAVANHYGISEDDAVEVVETQAILYCPEHEDNLQAIGNWARQQPQTPSESETPVLKRAV